jgi:hypothetical protein
MWVSEFTLVETRIPGISASVVKRAPTESAVLGVFKDASLAPRGGGQRPSLASPVRGAREPVAGRWGELVSVWRAVPEFRSL